MRISLTVTAVAVIRSALVRRLSRIYQDTACREMPGDRFVKRVPLS